MPDLTSRLKLRQAFVSAEKIEALLGELGVPLEIDLFSLDIDLNSTYHVWAALKQFRSAGGGGGIQCCSAAGPGMDSSTTSRTGLGMEQTRRSAPA